MNSLSPYCLSFKLFINLVILRLFLTAKDVKGSTLLLFDQEDIRYEFSDLSLEDRIYLRNFLREIVSFKGETSCPHNSCNSCQSWSFQCYFAILAPSEIKFVSFLIHISLRYLQVNLKSNLAYFVKKNWKNERHFSLTN